jgi:hypothetical protein
VLAVDSGWGGGTDRTRIRRRCPMGQPQQRVYQAWKGNNVRILPVSLTLAHTFSSWTGNLVLTICYCLYSVLS